MCFLSTTHAAVPSSERDALVALYYNTNGPDWTTSTNWLTGDPCVDSWYGVTCNLTGSITEIDLYENQLSGSILASLSDFSSLKKLNLSYNQLIGAVPPVLGNLTNLQILYLGDNQLSGTIPDTLGNLTSLDDLELENNQLSGLIPPELGNLTSLVVCIWQIIN